MSLPRISFAFATVLASVVLSVGAAACGGAAPPAAVSPGAATASAAPEASAPPAPPGPGEWDKWSKDQKMAYMKAAVAPKMKEVFQAFDAKKFADFKCKTCHGAGASEGNFKMPNPDLPKLPSTSEGFKALAADKPSWVEFMKKRVDPTVAQLIGEHPWDPKTNEGFGCFDCHTKKQ